MKIVVCVKQVPDTETRIRIAPDGKGIAEGDVNWIVSPYDEFAIEEALKHQGGEGRRGGARLRSAPTACSPRCATAWPWAPTPRST